MKIKFITLLGLIFTALLLTAQDSNTIHAKSFQLPEYNDKGELVCIIKGEKGKIFGREAIIEKAEVEISNKKNPLTLTTPKCKYLLKEKRCTSKEDVKIVGDGVKITGTGFDVDNNTRKIFIRSNVKVVWKKTNLKKKKSNTGEDKKPAGNTEKEK